MKAKGIFISTLLVIDTFLVSYAAGFHSRHVLVVNPKLPPVVHKIEESVDKSKTPPVVPKTKTDEKSHSAKDTSKSHGKNTKAKNSTTVVKPSPKPATKPVKETPAVKSPVKPKPKPKPKPKTTSDEKPGA